MGSIGWLNSVHRAALTIDFAARPKVNVSLASRVAHEAPCRSISFVANAGVGRKAEESAKTMTPRMRIVWIMPII